MPVRYKENKYYFGVHPSKGTIIKDKSFYQSQSYAILSHTKHLQFIIIINHSTCNIIYINYYLFFTMRMIFARLVIIGDKDYRHTTRKIIQIYINGVTDCFNSRSPAIICLFLVVSIKVLRIHVMRRSIHCFSCKL